MIPKINSLVLIKLVLKNPIPNPAKVILPIFIRTLARFSLCFFVNSKINMTILYEYNGCNVTMIVLVSFFLKKD